MANGDYNNNINYHSTPQSDWRTNQEQNGPAVNRLNDNQVEIDGQVYEKPMRIGQWIGNMILWSLPIVGFIMFIVHLCKGDMKSRRNYLLASLIIAGIGIGLLVVLFLVSGMNIQDIINGLPRS